MLLLFLIPAVLSGCSQEKKEAHVFYARILEIRERTMLVRPEEGSEEAGSADAFLVDMTGMDPSPEPAVGDYVKITYEGGIRETYPAGLDHVVSIVITDADSIPEEESGPEEDGEFSELWKGGREKVSVAGSLGEISMEIPEGWKAEAVGEGTEGLSYGLYGLTLEPAEGVSGRIELVMADSFRVCGTDLDQGEILLAGGNAEIGFYDGHENWDYIVFGDADPAEAAGRVIALHTDCSSWEERHWEEAMSILDTVTFVPAGEEE